MDVAAPATVVHLKRKGGVVVVGCDTYIGRAMYQGGWRLPESKWRNPYKVSGDTSLAVILQWYEEHVRASPDLMAALPELRGRRLGCWCVAPRCAVCGVTRAAGGGAPGPCGHANCHGDVLLRLLAELPAD